MNRRSWSVLAVVLAGAATLAVAQQVRERGPGEAGQRDDRVPFREPAVAPPQIAQVAGSGAIGRDARVALIRSRARKRESRRGWGR